MAPQIVLPAGQIRSLKEELEMAAEHAFEDAWRRNNRYQLEPEAELVVDRDEEEQEDTLVNESDVRFVCRVTVAE